MRWEMVLGRATGIGRICGTFVVVAADFFGGFGFGSFDSPSMALLSGIQSPSRQTTYSWKVGSRIRLSPPEKFDSCVETP